MRKQLAMKYSFKIILSIVFSIGLSFASNAQEIIRCGLDQQILHEFYNNPSLQQEYNTFLQNQQANKILGIDSTRVNTDTTYTVQVVVHVVYLGNNKYENIPDDIIQSQIDALNRDYNLLNDDTVNLRAFFKPFQGNARIKFELAKKTPTGANTNGITRTQGVLGSLTGWSPISNIALYALNIEAVKTDFLPIINSKGKSAWNVNKYINIWICDLNKESRKCPTCLNVCDTCGMLLGIATPPANAVNWGPLATNHGNNDGIIIDFRGFGQNNWFLRDSAAARFRQFYFKGRTPVHEVGHYLGLQHTWGNVILPGTGCTVDDFIEDTPEEEQAFANNLVRGATNPCDTSINTCSKTYLGRDWPDMFEDYMDYSTDICYNLFTKGQTDIMRFNLLTRRTGLITKRELENTVITTVKNQKLIEAGISFYPNPVNDNMIIHFNNNNKNDVVFDIFDITGKLISNQIIPKNTFDYSVNTSILSKGMYLIKLSNTDFSATDKFIKE
ncbi:MAG TPA: zinc-dependent metalloprotease [Chitinophagales bacterium]|nr:zinc-dependent metalloprotease [Chitinophagales bacterium]